MSQIRRVALVTGSGKRRIGWHVAQTLAERGYALAIHYRTSAAEAIETVRALQARGIDALALQADLADEHAIQAMMHETLDHFGRLDVLVNCAAIWKRKRLEDVTAAVGDATARGAIGFDAIKHLVLCRIERRPPRLDMTVYPYLPKVTVATT